MVTIDKLTSAIGQTCPICDNFHFMAVTMEEQMTHALRENWGVSINEAFPQLNAGEKSFIEFGYCADCQKVMFGNSLLADSPRYDFIGD